MSEPTWELLGGGGAVGGPVDFIGTWAAGTTYQPGQVVRHNGNDYLAVNPSTGLAPPAPAPQIIVSGASYGTSLPVATYDGQEAILVDSLTNPTYQWRFRYNAGSVSAYKWEFIGGAPCCIMAPDYTPTATSAYVEDTRAGATITFPRAGEYICDSHARVGGGAAGVKYLGFAHNYGGRTGLQYTGEQFITIRERGVFTASATLRNVFYSVGTAPLFDLRTLSVIPARVA